MNNDTYIFPQLQGTIACSHRIAGSPVTTTLCSIEVTAAIILDILHGAWPHSEDSAVIPCLQKNQSHDIAEQIARPNKNKRIIKGRASCRAFLSRTTLLVQHTVKQTCSLSSPSSLLSHFLRSPRLCPAPSRLRLARQALSNAAIAFKVPVAQPPPGFSHFWVSLFRTSLLKLV